MNATDLKRIAIVLQARKWYKLIDHAADLLSHLQQKWKEE